MKFSRNQSQNTSVWPVFRLSILKPPENLNSSPELCLKTKPARWKFAILLHNKVSFFAAVALLSFIWPHKNKNIQKTKVITVFSTQGSLIAICSQKNSLLPAIKVAFNILVN